MNKNIKTFTTILIIIAVLLILYNVINNKPTKKINNSTNNSNNQNEIVIWNDIELFPENDENVKVVTLSYDGVTCEDDEYTNCSEIDVIDKNKLNFTKNDIKIEFNCLNYFIDEDDNNYKYCKKNQIKLDNKVSYTFNNNLEYEDTKTLIFKTDKYYIIKEVNTIYGQGDLIIFDLSGKVVKKIDKTITEFDVLPDNNDDDMEAKLYNPRVNDNKLYYVYSDYINFENGLDNKVHLGFLDLNNLEYTETYSLKAIASMGI